MHIESYESRGTIGLKFVDSRDKAFIDSVRRYADNGKILELKEANEIKFSENDLRLQLIFNLERSFSNSLIGTTLQDDFFVRAVHKSIFIAETGIIPVATIWCPKFAGIEVTITRCTICSGNLINYLECRSCLCNSCHQHVQKYVIDERRARELIKEDIVDLNWYSEYRENRRSRGSGKRS